MSDMPKKKTKKDTGWSDIRGGQAFVIPMDLLNHDNFVRLSPYAHKLLHDLARQFTGSNNGYLHPGIGKMALFGWRSSATLHKTVRELVHYGIIKLTRQGGKNIASLYAFTFRRIHSIKSKPLDVPSTLMASDEWVARVDDFTLNTGRRKNKKSLVRPVNKVCSPREQADGSLVRPVNKHAAACSPGEQVDHLDEG